jgi:hypothetical protein
MTLGRFAIGSTAPQARFDVVINRAEGLNLKCVNEDS